MKKINFSLIITLLFFCSCNKTTTELTVNDSSQKLTTLSLAESTTLDGFLTSTEWGNFSYDNKKFADSINKDSVKIESYYDSINKIDMVLVCLPLKNVNDTAHVIISSTKADFQANDFNKFEIMYQKNSSVQNYNSVYYGKITIEVYTLGIERIIQEDINSNIISDTIINTLSNLTNNSTYHPNLPSAIVAPTASCINSSLDNLDAACTVWCRVAKKVSNIVFTAWDAADMMTAVGWCMGHNNSAWH